MSTKDVKYIYDSLFAFENKKRHRRSYPIHKKLNFKDGTYDITDWINKHIDIAKNANILDAGCGTGYTLLELCKNTQRRGLGISLSENEIINANQSALRLNLSGATQFKVHDYSLPFENKYDIIIAIESLKHAPDIKKTFANLVEHLKPGAKLIIVEDFYIPNIAKEKLGKSFMEKWSVQELYTEAYYDDSFKELDCEKIKEIDFTPLVQKKNKLKTNLMMNGVGMFSKIMPQGEKKELAHILQGGLIMDHFYKIGAFEYKLLVYQK